MYHRSANIRVRRPHHSTDMTQATACLFQNPNTMTEKTSDEVGGEAEGVYYADNGAIAPTTGAVRRGHLFFGFGCDMRRSVLIVNIIAILTAFVALIGFFLASAYLSSGSDDDNLNAHAPGNFGVFAAVVVLNTVLASTFAGFGIWGALHFNMYFVIAAAIWHAISAVLSLVYGDLVGAVMAGCFLYPHIVLVQEMRSGIMTEANYPNEKKNCCYNV
jgi:hypothetical protein